MPSVINRSSYLVNVQWEFLPIGSPELVLPDVEISGFIKETAKNYTGEYKKNDYTSRYNIIQETK